MGRRSDPRQFTFEGYLKAEPEELGEGSLDLDSQVRNAIKKALKTTQLSRAEVAAGMTDLIFGDANPSEIKKGSLDAWTAPSREAWRFPAAYLPAFVHATGSFDVLDILAQACGCRVIRGEDAALLELGALEAARRELDRRETELKRSIPTDLLKQFQQTMERRR